MLFRNIILTALFAALISGVVLGVMQAFSTSKIIYAAEVYEVEDEASSDHQHSHDNNNSATHSHEAEWQPKDGIERVSYTVIADILIAFGHSLLLTSFMALLFLKFGKPEISWRSGLIIGIGGYVSFYLATIIGLPPEIPGSIAADLHARQIWWTLTIVMTAMGLTTLYLAPNAAKLLGLVFIAIPHIIGAPQPEVEGFLNHDPVAVSALEQLQHQFLISTAWVNAIYWLVLGLFSGLFAKKMLQTSI